MAADSISMGFFAVIVGHPHCKMNMLYLINKIMAKDRLLAILLIKFNKLEVIKLIQKYLNNRQMSKMT